MKNYAKKGRACSRAKENSDEWVHTWKEYLKYTNQDYKRLNKYVKIFKFNNIPKDKTIIDLGCGNGTLLNLLKSKGYKHLKGIEFEKKLIQEDKTGLIREGDILKLDNLKPQGYDVVILIGVLHHLKNLKEIALCLKGIRRILKKGGKLYSLEPYGSFLRTIVTKLLLETPLGNIHPFFRLQQKFWVLEKNLLKTGLKLNQSLMGILKN